MAKPREKVTLHLPEGVIGIRSASCSKGCSLMDQTTSIHNMPSIKVNYAVEGKDGVLHLDPLYGRFDSVHEWDPPDGAIAEFSCPSCAVSLRSDEGTCQACGGPMFALQLPSGIVEGCLRHGCLYHKMTIVDSDALMEDLFRQHHLDTWL